MASHPPPDPMASPPLPTAAPHPSLLIEIGPDGIARESPVIAYTEKIIEAEKLQLKRYIQENYSKIREVEREFESLSLELKLTAGPKKAALEHLRKKIELSTEKIHAAKLKEKQAKEAWEAAAQAVKDEEAIKLKICDDLNQLVQESTSTQFLRLEELKRRLEALNPSRISSDAPDGKMMRQTPSNAVELPAAVNQSAPVRVPDANAADSSSGPVSSDAKNQRVTEATDKKRIINSGRAKGNLLLPKGRGSGSGWTGSGFDVDSGR